MKTFKQLLLAPALLGLAAPLAASAQDVASLNGMSAVNEYMNQQDIDRFRAWESKNQVTSVSQFSDVRPTDWAYQALSNLVDKFGCVAGYPNGTFKGGNPLSRFEAAALLNACLDRVTEQSEELKRLLDEFQQELTVLRGRVDGLEKKVGKLEAQQFSTTTKLQGEATFVVGGLGYSGSAYNSATNAYNARSATGAGPTANPALNGVSFNYDLRLNLTTSWTGKDLLYTRLRAGNFGNSAFSGAAGSIPNARMDKSFGSAATENVVQIDRLYYRFPVGNELTLTVGPRARNTEMVAFRPQAYNADILDFFTLAGAPGAYNKATGSAVGLVWKQTVKKGQPFLTAALSYVAENGNNANTNATTAATGAGGLFSSYGGNNFNVQLGAKGQNWGAAAYYRYGTSLTRSRVGTTLAFEPLQSFATAGNQTSSNSLGLGAYWEPKQSGWVPSISLGWGYSGYTQTVAIPAATSNSVTNIGATQSWAAMFQWSDAFAKGNAAGFAFGQPTFVTSTRNGRSANDSTYAFEWFYRFRVSDSISVTPAVFYLSNSLGQSVSNNPAASGQSLNNLGIVVQTQFKF
ncbi:MAG: porin [Cyanobacteria bacterium K_DeepCast_35m_m2_023]|nr:porin [Cyanobacteria bacterium K_DeepCast_35m_m2_023]